MDTHAQILCLTLIVESLYQDVCNMWCLSSKMFHGDMAKVVSSGMFTRSCWSSQEDSVAENEGLYTWGRTLT